MRSVVGTVSVACALLVTACGDEDEQSGQDGGSQQDGGNRPQADGGTASDGGGQPDGGVTSDGGTTADGGSIEQPEGSHFFLSTGEPDNTSAPTVEVDQAGNVHTVYPAFAGGDAYYAFCPVDSCNDSEDAQVVKFQTEGTVYNAMLRLTSDGKPRVLLAAYAKVYYATCEQDCGAQQSWTISEIYDHDSKREITGEALALDNQGRPRFLMHTYRALLGIGQQAPEQIYAQCDANCHVASSWRYDVVEDEIWYGSDLKIDAQNRVHVATTVYTFEGTSEQPGMTAYLACESGCNTDGSFHGVGFVPPYESRTEAVTMHPTTSLAVTKDGAPRVALITENEEGVKQLIYFACDSACTDGSKWSGTILTQHNQLGAGIDLALDERDHPRLVYTFAYNILLRYCDVADCTAEGVEWGDALVESSTSIPADDIFLWENCTVGAWFLHDPSLALTRSGAPRVGYQSRDISGGWSNPNPNKPGCTAGTDMSWSRLALLAPLQ